MSVKDDAMTRDEAVALCDKLEAYPFESEGGPLELCVHWQQLREFVVSPRPEAPAWQPIETAPKDGTEIWALVSGRPYFVSWTTHGTQHSEPWWRDREGYGLTETDPLDAVALPTHRGRSMSKKYREKHTNLIDSLAAKIFPFQESEEEQEAFTDTGRRRVDEWIDEVLATKHRRSTEAGER